MANILVKAPKLDIIRPEVVDVYFAKKVEKNGKITFEKIEKGYIDNKIYIVIETSHIKEGFSLKINIFQYLEKNGQVHKKNIKEEDLIVKVGNYKDKGGSTTQAIAEVMLGFSTKNYLFYYPLEKESKLYVTLSVDADGNGEADKTVCFNLKEYMYNYIDAPNFWYIENKFEVMVDQCQNMIIDNISDGIINHTKIQVNIISELHYGNIGKIEMIILHRTANDSVSSTLNSFKSKRNGTYYGTHFLVGKDGTIYQTANLDKYTNHSAGNNRKSIGIEVVGKSLDKDGNYSLGRKGENPVVAWEPLTEVQANSVACLVKALLHNYNLSKLDLKVHEDLNPKTEGEGRTVYNAIIDKI